MSSINYISTQQAAEIAGVSAATVWNWIKGGTIPSSMIQSKRYGPFRTVHKINKAKFEAWLKEVSNN